MFYLPIKKYLNYYDACNFLLFSMNSIVLGLLLKYLRDLFMCRILFSLGLDISQLSCLGGLRGSMYGLVDCMHF